MIGALAKAGRGLIIVGLLLAVLASCLLLRVVHPSGGRVEEESLEPGDIIFVDLYDGWSDTGYWDHAALYVGWQPGASVYPGPVVVEATYDAGVSFTPLGLFLERDRPARMSVRRLKEMPGRAEIVHKTLEYATAQTSKPFDLTGVVGIPLKINEENLHCVEIVWRAFKAAGLDLDANDGVLLYPDDVYHSPELEAA